MTARCDVVLRDPIEDLEAHMLNLPQVECPVRHHFGPHLYIREVTLPAGALAIGHAQKLPHLNVMLKGVVAMLNEHGDPVILRAPQVFVGQPGRKVGYVLEECVWHNIYSTDETDIEKLEAMFLDKSPVFTTHEQVQALEVWKANQSARDDFGLLLAQTGFTAEQVREQSENEADQVALPAAYASRVVIRTSPIEGRGLFLSVAAEPGEVIAPARIGGLRTHAGRFTNHSPNPNAVFVMRDVGDIDLVATRRISGCQGGSHGEEVTVDYRQALALSGISIPREVK